METSNWLANYKAISFCGNTTDQYFAEEDEVIQQINETWMNNSNHGNPNTDQFFADEDEVSEQDVDEVNWSKIKLLTTMEQITTKIEEDLILESENYSSPTGLQAHSCKSISTDDTSSNEIGDIIRKYKITSRSDSLDIESLISPRYLRSHNDNDSDYDSYDDSMKKKKEETKKNKKNKKKSTTKSADYRNAKQNDKKNIPGLIAQKVKTAILASNEFYTRVSKILGLSEQDEEELKKDAKLYNKQAKTWKAIRKFLRRNPRAGKIYLKFINQYLAEENREFYKEWLLYGRMSEKTKRILEKDKNFFVNKFRALLSGDDEELEGEAPRKRIKTK